MVVGFWFLCVRVPSAQRISFSDILVSLGRVVSIIPLIYQTTSTYQQSVQVENTPTYQRSVQVDVVLTGDSGQGSESDASSTATDWKVLINC